MTAILVTGAGGFIGSHLVDLLLQKSHTVIGIDNLRTGTRENLANASKNERFRFLLADIRDDDLVNKIGSDVKTIYHLAAISSVKMSIEDPLEVNDVNTRGTLNILEAARTLHAERVVFSSSAAVYGDPETMPIREDTLLHPLSPYAASKIAAEMYVHSYSASYDFDMTILRFFNVYGPRQAYSEYSGVVSIFVNQMLANLPLTIEGDGEQTRSFIHVRDVIRALLLAGEKRTAIGKTMNISGTDLVAVNHLARLITDSSKASAPDIVHGPPRLGDVRDSIGNIERAQKLLGFTPEIPLEEGLHETIEWYRTHAHTT